MEMYLFVYKDLIRLQILTETSRFYFVYRRDFNCPPVFVYRVHDIIFGGRWDWGFCTCDVASLVMYCIDAHRKIVTKSLYGTVLLATVYFVKYRYVGGGGVGGSAASTKSRNSYSIKVMRSCLVAGDICSDACAESLLRCCGHHDKLSREEQVKYNLQKWLWFDLLIACCLTAEILRECPLETNFCDLVFFVKLLVQ